MAYSGTVNTVAHKTIVVFIPALDVDVDVQRNHDASVQSVFVLTKDFGNLDVD